MVILIILMNIYDGGNYGGDLPPYYCVYFILSFGYNFNVISLYSFSNVVLFSNVILCFII